MLEQYAEEFLNYLAYPTIVLILGVFVNYKFERHKKEQTRLDEQMMKRQQENVDKEKKLYDTIKSIESKLSSLEVRINKNDNMTQLVYDSMKNLKTGGMALLKDRIVQSCRYFYNKGYITISARDNIKSMYDNYHMIGGNGIGTLWYDRMMTLPIEPDECIYSPPFMDKLSPHKANVEMRLTEKINSTEEINKAYDNKNDIEDINNLRL